MQAVAKEQFDDNLPRSELRGQFAQTRLGFVGRNADRQLLAEFFGQLSLYSQRSLVIEWNFLIANTEPAPQFILWQFLHAYQEATLPTLATRPSRNKIVDGLPPTKIEIPNTEVSAFGNLKRLSKGR